jgi:hypothetical protein
MGERTRTAAWGLMLAMIAGTTELSEAYAGPLGLAALTAGPAMRGSASSAVAEGPSPYLESDRAIGRWPASWPRRRADQRRFPRLITSIQASNGIVYVEWGDVGMG